MVPRKGRKMSLLWLVFDAAKDVLSTAGQMVKTGVDAGKSIGEATKDTAKTVLDAAEDVFLKK
jgi:hypothetical protein